jgi:pimeloyl-ACP methyl ester carboxylesterase
MSSQRKPSIVFCHGLWADGSCFGKVIPALQADGHEVMAVQYGLNNYADDVATVKRTLGRVNSPAILVGHSYGGATITGAGTDERVAGLVYIAAVVPDVHESVQSQLDKYPTEIFSQIEVAGGRVWIKPEGIKYFAGDLSEREQKVVWATHYPPAADLLEQQNLDAVAWRSKPSWYVLAKKDQTVHPDLQRLLVKRINATAVETDSSHVIMLSQPEVVIEVIRKAAAAVQKSLSNKQAA